MNIDIKFLKIIKLHSLQQAYSVACLLSMRSQTVFNLEFVISFIHHSQIYFPDKYFKTSFFSLPVCATLAEYQNELAARSQFEKITPNVIDSNYSSTVLFLWQNPLKSVRVDFPNRRGYLRHTFQ